MIRSPVSPEVRALLEQERILPAVSPSQRARAMARARASMASPGVWAAVPSPAASRTRWAAAAAAALVVSAAVGAAAYEIHSHFTPAPVARRAVALAPRGVVSVPAPPAPAVTVPDRPAVPVTTGAPAGLSATDAARAELHLLRQARAAVARGDFATALSTIAEHSHRFKNGRLVEEREALRVKALAGVGRTAEARHAAVAFRARFPRSVLLPSVSQMPASAQ